MKIIFNILKLFMEYRATAPRCESPQNQEYGTTLRYQRLECS